MDAEPHRPSHADFFVEFVPGAFCSGLRTRKVSYVVSLARSVVLIHTLVALEAFEVDDVLANLEGLTKAPKAYSSVQCGRGPDDHVELNSDLVYSAYAGVSQSPLQFNVRLFLPCHCSQSLLRT